MADKQIVLKGSMHLPLIATMADYRDWHTLWDANTELKKKRQNPLILFHGDKNHVGDTVVVPKLEKKSISKATKTHNPFKTVSDNVFLRLRVLDENLEPVKDATYVLQVSSKRYPDKGEGEFEEGGLINVEVSKQAQSGRLVVRYKPPKEPDESKSPSGGKGGSGGQSPTAPTGQKASPPTGSGTGAPKVQGTPDAAKEPDVIEMVYDLSIGALNPIQEQAPDDKCLSGVQQRLNNLGFDAGAVDGIDGPNTQGAIKRFQTKFQLTVNGQADAKTQKALYDFHDQPGKVPKPTPPPKPTKPHPQVPVQSGTGGGQAKPTPPPKPTKPHPQVPGPSGTGGGQAKPKPTPPPKPTKPHP